MEKTTDKPVFYKSDGDAVIEDLALLSFLDVPVETSAPIITRKLSEMSRVIEAFVFYERLFVFSFKIDKENCEAYWNSENPLVLASIIEELSKEKVLNFVQPLPVDWAPQPSALLSQIKELKLIPTAVMTQFNDFSIGYYLFQQEISRRAGIPFISSDSKYVKSFIYSSSTLKHSLSQELVKRINLKIEKDIEELMNLENEIEIYVPPFLSIVLDNVIKGASFGESILEVRRQFKSLRKLFAEYNSIFHNSDRTLKKQMQDVSKILTEIERISSSFTFKDRSKFAIWGDTFDFLIDSTTDIKNYEIIKSVGLIPRLMKLSKEILRSLILKRRYSSVHKLKKDFYNIKGYSQLINKAISPSLEKARTQFPNGYICISPGNPFQDPLKLTE